MKKFIAILLTCLLLFSATIIGGSASEEPLVVSVANDLHYNLKNATDPVSKHNNVNADFFHAGHGGQMPEESVALIHAYLDLAANDESDVVFLPGDLTDGGTFEQHTALTALLSDFENKTGKSVYVVPGNHDLFGSGIAEFKALYGAFGYNDAIAQDPLSASYVVDLNNEYRLLAIDSTKPGQSPHGMTEERAEWIRQQCANAKQDGKKLIAMMHHNLIEHFVFAKQLHPTAIVDVDIALAEILASNGVKYVFSGHTHDHDIAQYTAADGSVVYDVVTGSMFCYPCPYRVVTFGADVKFETRRVTSVDTSLLPPGITDAALALAATDMTAYSKICTFIGVRDTVLSYIKTPSVLKLLKLDKENDAEMYAIMTQVLNKANEMLVMPLYSANAAEEEISIEAYLAQYDIAIPESEYTDLADVAVHIYQSEVVGDESYHGYSPEVLLLTRGLAAVLHYALEDVSPENYATVLGYVTEMLGLELSAELLQIAGDAVGRMRGLELWLTTFAMPLICEYTVDNAPADNNVTLPGYGNSATTDGVSFFVQIKDFFLRIFNALMTFFAHFFG